jgi:hypothetical protein
VLERPPEDERDREEEQERQIAEGAEAQRVSEASLAMSLRGRGGFAAAPV